MERSDKEHLDELPQINPEADSCMYCGSRTKLCKASGPASVGFCRWKGLIAEIRFAKNELTTGRFIDRASRGHKIIEKALEKYGDE